MALGNASGQIYVWNLVCDSPNEVRRHILKHPQCEKTIRQCAFSPDGNILVAICDDSTIWRWDRAPVVTES